MTAALILNTFVKFYTTEVQLKNHDPLNDWANYSLSYIQYFTGKKIIYPNGKIEHVDPKNVEGKFSWILSAIKSTAYFLLAIPFVILGTLLRALSLDSPEVSKAIFNDKTLRPPRKRNIRPAKDQPISPRVELKTSAGAPTPSVNSQDARSSSASHAEQKTSDVAWNLLLQAGKGLKGAVAASFQAMQAMGPEGYKSQAKNEMETMLGLLLTFNEDLFRHAQNPGVDIPNFAAVAEFIKTQRQGPSYQDMFLLRDSFIVSLPTLTGLGVQLSPQDMARWEESDVKCQTLMNAPELKAYLDEKPPSEWQNELTSQSDLMRSQALATKAQAQETMKGLSEFFKQLLALLEKKPIDRSAILSLLNAKENEFFLGASAFSFANVYKAQNRFLRNFYDEPLFSLFVYLYTSCFTQLHTAKFTIPTSNNPLSKDLLESSPPTAPASSRVAASTAPATLQQEATEVSRLLKYMISFSEELLEHLSVEAAKAFIENKRKDSASYQYPFYTRCYLIFILSSTIKDGVPLDPTEVARWRTLDTELEILMQDPRLKPYLNEAASPQLKKTEPVLFESLKIALFHDKTTNEEAIRSNTAFFQILATSLRQRPLARDQIELAIYGADEAKYAQIFSNAKLYLAARGFFEEMLQGELYENYFSSYLACITLLQTLRFRMPSPGSHPAEPQQAPAPSLSSQQIKDINRDLKMMTNFYEELLGIPPSDTAAWLDAQKSKSDYCYPFHWGKTHAETLKKHRSCFYMPLIKKWEKLYPKCVARLTEYHLRASLDEEPVAPGECKQS